jgi:hypothetical protein
VVEGKKLLLGLRGGDGNGQATQRSPHNERVLKEIFILRKLYMASDAWLEAAMFRCDS